MEPDFKIMNTKEISDFFREWNYLKASEDERNAVGAAFEQLTFEDLEDKFTVPKNKRDVVIAYFLEKDGNRLEARTLEQMQYQMQRNGRWGTCGDCPREEVEVDGEMVRMPQSEKCPHTSRYDHWIGTPHPHYAHEFPPHLLEE